jgi:hypothetical protein
MPRVVIFLSNFSHWCGRIGRGHTPPARTQGDTTILYRLDPLHPDLLVCEACAAVGHAEPMTPTASSPTKTGWNLTST